VWALVHAHLETLNVDPRFPDFFSLTVGWIEQGGGYGDGLTDPIAETMVTQTSPIHLPIQPNMTSVA